MRRIRLLAFFIVVLVAVCLAAPYLPYPARYCAKHPDNPCCVAYRPKGQP